MPDDASTPARPGTACLGCRRRKLKCSRESGGCRNCTKADLPCVYPTPEIGVKRKRGPYKKDKAPRERHLEDLVRYLEPKDAGGDQLGPQEGRDGTSAAVTSSSGPAVATISRCSGLPGVNPRRAPQSRNGNAEELVKDALVALTRSSVDEIEASAEEEKKHSSNAEGHAVSYDAGPPGSHPHARRMFEYWDIFVQRIDPLLKIIHCPSFTGNLFAALDNPKQLGTATETLLFSICYASVSACTAKETMNRFGDSRAALLERYSRIIEAKLSDNYSVPALESLQALVLYLTAMRRDNSDISFRAHFSLAVRMAQIVGLHEDPGNKYSHFEAEMRRRLWWTLCGLESRSGEEGVARQTSIQEERNVKICSNLNDLDIDPNMKEVPAGRSGIADTSFFILKYEVVALAHRLWKIRKRYKFGGRGDDAKGIQREQQAALDHFRSTMQTRFIDHCDTSRRYDRLMVMFYEAMSVKMHTIVNHPNPPPHPQTPTTRLDRLHASVTLIAHTIDFTRPDAGLGDWRWYFRGYTQWHAVAVVVAELGRSTNQSFARNAWAVLDPVLQSWERVYKVKRGEGAWDYVEGMIGRARRARGKRVGVGGRDGETGAAGTTEPDAQEGRVAWQPSLPTSDHPPPPFSPPNHSTNRPDRPLPPPPANASSLAPNTIAYLPNFAGMLSHKPRSHDPRQRNVVDFPAGGGLMPPIEPQQDWGGMDVVDGAGMVDGEGEGLVDGEGEVGGLEVEGGGSGVEMDVGLGGEMDVGGIDFGAWDAVFGDFAEEAGVAGWEVEGGMWESNGGIAWDAGHEGVGGSAAAAQGIGRSLWG